MKALVFVQRIWLIAYLQGSPLSFISLYFLLPLSSLQEHDTINKHEDKIAPILYFSCSSGSNVVCICVDSQFCASNSLVTQLFFGIFFSFKGLVHC